MTEITIGRKRFSREWVGGDVLGFARHYAQEAEKLGVSKPRVTVTFIDWDEETREWVIEFRWEVPAK